MLSSQAQSVFAGTLLAMACMLALMGKTRVMTRGPKALLAWLNAATDRHLCACDRRRPPTRRGKPCGMMAKRAKRNIYRVAKGHHGKKANNKKQHFVQHKGAVRCGHGARSSTARGVPGVPSSMAWRNAGAHAATHAATLPVLNHVGCTAPR
jgi:hypothetical protein